MNETKDITNLKNKNYDEKLKKMNTRLNYQEDE